MFKVYPYIIVAKSAHYLADGGVGKLYVSTYYFFFCKDLFFQSFHLKYTSYLNIALHYISIPHPTPVVKEKGVNYQNRVQNIWVT